MTKPDTEFPDTQASLLRQLRTSEDEQAWQQFVSMYRPVIYRIARKRGLQDADAQDLTQKVLVSIAGAISRWEQRDESIRFRHWLRRIARNAVVNALTRQPKDRAAGGTSVHQMLDEQPQDDAGLSDEICLEHRRELFIRAAAQVRTEVAVDTWQVFELAVINGLPIEETAAQLNKSVGAAYAARGRVMERLRRAVERLEESEA